MVKFIGGNPHMSEAGISPHVYAQFLCDLKKIWLRIFPNVPRHVLLMGERFNLLGMVELCISITVENIVLMQ